VGSKADMALHKERVLPVLNDWESEVGNYEVDTDSYTSAHLTEFMKLDVTIDSGSKNARISFKEVRAKIIGYRMIIIKRKKHIASSIKRATIKYGY
jgi:hypothetical protein